MKSLVTIAALIAAAPLCAAPGGEIDTLQPGDYACELPGDATGPAGRRVAAEDFTVLSGSSYSANGKRGTYLLTGDTVTITSGPRSGQRFRRQSSGFLRQLTVDGTDGDLRCVRRRRNNS